MKQNDEDLSELELKSFWYKLHKKSICPKMDLIISFSILNCFWWTKDQIFWNEATGNQNNPKFGQPQPKNRPDHGPVQFGPMDFFGP